MEKIQTDNAPQAIGPYSQAIRSGNMIFISGQIGIDPKTGEFAGETVARQTEQALRNINAVLAAVPGLVKNIVKTTVYLTNMGDFTEMNTVYACHFSDSMNPARATVGVNALPKSAKVEIEAIAIIE